MDNLTALPIATDGFASVLATLRPDQYDLPTPCEGWTVADLLGHVIGGTRMSAAILNGASREEATAIMDGFRLEDPAEQFASENAELIAAFAAPGALERSVAHPRMEMQGAQLLGFRVGDALVHTWDLARSIGGDETLDPRVVEVVWTNIQPMLPVMGSVGSFGEGPSGDVSDGAALQTRLLDAMGRRP